MAAQHDVQIMRDQLTEADLLQLTYFPPGHGPREPVDKESPSASTADKIYELLTSLDTAYTKPQRSLCKTQVDEGVNCRDVAEMLRYFGGALQNQEDIEATVMNETPSGVLFPVVDHAEFRMPGAWPLEEDIVEGLPPITSLTGRPLSWDPFQEELIDEGAVDGGVLDAGGLGAGQLNSSPSQASADQQENGTTALYADEGMEFGDVIDSLLNVGGGHDGLQQHLADVTCDEEEDDLASWQSLSGDSDVSSVDNDDAGDLDWAPMDIEME